MTSIAAFAWACLVIELTPGPNMTYLAVLTLSDGRRAGLAAVAGVALGLAIVGLAAALGVATIISSSPMLYDLLRFAGISYLLWLAYETWRGESGTDEAATATDGGAARAFRNGLVTNLLNPKAALFYVAVLPVFLDKSLPLTGQAILLAGVYVAIATAVHLAIVLLASRARPLIETAERQASVRRVFAVMLIAIAIWTGWTTRR
jgi:threonine/homoserine/homoserine lactone efflux protein